MLVRCGRCRAELEVAGAGEFLCPQCGTRNVVRGPAAPGSYDLHDLTVPPGVRDAPQPDTQTDPSTRWVGCPECSWRFAIGLEAASVTCPNCRASLSIGEGGTISVQA